MVVVVVIADSVKADAPGFMGGRAVTPFLDRLAGEGSWFRQAFASGLWTIPSLMSLLTGVLGHKIGVCRWRHRFPRRQPTLLTAFAAAGFDVSCLHPYPQWGFLTTPGRGAVCDSQELDEVRAALRGRRGHDRLVVVHYWWTHLPYVNKRLPRDPWQAACDFAVESLGRHPARIAAKLEDLFLRSVAYFSEEVLPRYLDAASAGGDEVLLAVTADHGETWGRSLPPGRRVETVYDLHGRWATDETAGVPLLFHGTSAHGPIAVHPALGGFARGVDFAPTLAALAGVPWPGPIPTDEGPQVCERESAAADVIGTSLADSIWQGLPSPHDEAPTVSSHNTHVPRTFPDDGKLMWRTHALRTRHGWFVWDGAEAQGSFAPAANAETPDEPTTAQVFDRLRRQHLESVDADTIVEDDVVDALRDENAVVKQRLQTLGYLD